MSDDKRIAELERELAALRELMNCYNLGGWTDANAAMKRALAAEAALAERTKERDAAIAERDMTRLYCAEVASYVCNPIYDKVENREGIAADAKAMATGEMVAHYNDIKKQTKRAIRAEAERDAALARADAAERDAARYRWLRNDSLQYLVAGPVCVLADRWGDLKNLHDDEPESNWHEKKFAPVTVDGAKLDAAIDAARAEGA